MAKGKASSDERTLLGEYARALAAVGEAPPSKRSEALRKLDLNTMGFLDLSRDANSVMDKAIDNSDDSAIVEFAEAFKATRERLRAEHAGTPADELATVPSPPPAEPPPRPAADPPRFAVAEGPQAPAFVAEARPLAAPPPVAPPPVERPKPPEPAQPATAQPAPAQRPQKLGRGTVRMTYNPATAAQPPAPPPVVPPVARPGAAPAPPPIAPPPIAVPVPPPVVAPIAPAAAAPAPPPVVPPMAPPAAALAPPPVVPPMAPPGAAPAPPPRVSPQPPPAVPVRSPSSDRFDAQSAPIPQSEPSPPARSAFRGGDTIMRPGLSPMDPDGLPAPVHFQEPRLALMQYAALRAEILGSPEGMRGAVYARYNLTEPDDAAESAAWNARFSADRALFAQYMQVFSYFRALAKR
jgi:hypothetical protein